MNPQTKEFEFGGPLGTTFITALLPCTVYGLFYACNGNGCPANYTSPFRNTADEVFSLSAMTACLAWFAFCVAAWYLLPGTWIKGTKLRNAKVLDYKINAWNTFILTNVVMLTMLKVYGFAPFIWIADHYLSLATSAIIFSTGMSFYLYSTSFNKDRLLAEGGNSGNIIYDWFIGRELNPRIGSFDLKSFCELRPGLIGWFILDVSLAIKQYSLLGHVTDSMVLVVLFQTYYVMDALYNEPAIFTTMDIIMDGFGFMLAFGDMVWVPFTYSLQARYLVHFPKHLGFFYTALILAVKILGFVIFRGANSQKNAFRTNPEDPSVKHITYIETEAGTRLMTGGWWGMARHINYFGDWLMGLAWCLPTGFDTPITYFYA
jgi:delta14-sterol reductase